MNKLFVLLIVLIFFNSCSLNKNVKIWKKKDENDSNNEKIRKVFVEKKKTITEFNKELILDLSSLEINKIVNEDKNDFGNQKYDGHLKKLKKYKFSKIKNINNINLKPIILSDGIIFFDKKGNVIRYNDKQKIVWKKNYYSKFEKKLNPILNFVLDEENLIIIDNIAKYYSLNLGTGELNWKKNSTYPINSEIKKSEKHIYIVDYKNILRCYRIIDGSECWNLSTDDTFTISDTEFSLILDKEMVIFNNSIGDITAVDTRTGIINWQLPTQGRQVANESYNYKTSELVSDGKSIFFSNNKNEFYSIDVKTGTINWISEINSTVMPIVIKNIIFTISTDGYLYAIEKNKGNIIRITDVYTYIKKKNRKNVSPVGFRIGSKNLYLTNSDGSLSVVDLSSGKIIKTTKVSNSYISKPVIFNNNLFIVKNGSVIQYK